MVEIINIALFNRVNNCGSVLIGSSRCVFFVFVIVVSLAAAAAVVVTNKVKRLCRVRVGGGCRWQW